MEPKTMDEQKLMEDLKSMGWTEVYISDDVPGQHYPEHDHPHGSLLVILSGELDATVNGIPTILKSGDRLQIPHRVRHAVTVGMNGCRYIVGKKSNKYGLLQ